jgi:hypothetical protein
MSGMAHEWLSKDHLVRKANNCRIAANAESQCEYGKSREAQVAMELAQGVARVCSDVLVPQIA